MLRVLFTFVLQLVMISVAVWGIAISVSSFMHNVPIAFHAPSFLMGAGLAILIMKLETQIERERNNATAE